MEFIDFLLNLFIKWKLSQIPMKKYIFFLIEWDND